jgi:hypothetical protein
MEVQAILYRDGRIKLICPAKLLKDSVEVKVLIPDDSLSVTNGPVPVDREEQLEISSSKLAVMLCELGEILGDGYTYVEDGRTDKERFAEELEAYYR